MLFHQYAGLFWELHPSSALGSSSFGCSLQTSDHGYVKEYQKSLDGIKQTSSLNA
jgi:hypothetical protein